MKVLVRGSQFFLCFDKGEEVFAGLLNFAKKNRVNGAAFEAIGACSELEVGVYNVKSRSYEKRKVKENLEIISLIGNISFLKGQPMVHAHGCFGRRDLTVIGGHVFRVVVSATCEIFLIKLDGEMKRELNKNLNLNLLL